MILSAFAVQKADRNKNFNSLRDFNKVTSNPLLRTPNGAFLSMQTYALAEAMYEAPFFWMIEDKPYFPALSKNRGEFTENFVAERLGLVFGGDRVHLNVDVYRTKAEKASDIDVLVIWGDRVIIVQTKSKRLTLESRKGNIQNIRSDFKKAIQDAYNQGAVCAKNLFNENCRLVTRDEITIALPAEIKEVYIFCVVSDHYPALNLQAQQFLTTNPIERVQPPLVMDIFTLDVMTEMLNSPLQFLSYVNRRARYSKQIVASQELTILGYHLKKTYG